MFAQESFFISARERYTHHIASVLSWNGRRHSTGCRSVAVLASQVVGKSLKKKAAVSTFVARGEAEGRSGWELVGRRGRVVIRSKLKTTWTNNTQRPQAHGWHPASRFVVHPPCRL